MPPVCYKIISGAIELAKTILTLILRVEVFYVQFCRFLIVAYALMEGRVGNLCEIQGEAVFEWELKKFFPLSNRKEKRFRSPKLYFSGTSWELCIYQNGYSDEAKEWISLFLVRSSGGFPVSVDYTLSIKTVDEKTYIDRKGEKVFEEKNSGFGIDKLISKSELLEKKSQFAATDDIIVVCTLKNNEKKNTEGSLFNRLQKVSDNLKEIFSKRSRADMILKVDGQYIQAHQIVLETRSPVFADMFKHDTKTDKVSVDDCDKRSVELLLEYIYSGDTETFTTENVLSVYAVAEKYGIKDIKAMCLDFIMKNLSVEWVCEVIKFAEKYKLEEVNQRSREFFKDNSKEVLATENWKTFSREKHNLAVELLGTLVETLLPN